MPACPYCDYDLGGLIDPDRCPECGHIVATGYLQALMCHRIHKDEQALYKIALVGWSVDAAGCTLFIFNRYTVMPALVGLVISGGLMGLSVYLAHKSRTTWPRRFVRSQQGGIDGAAPKGLFFALSAWALPCILLCGVLASLAP